MGHKSGCLRAGLGAVPAKTPGLISEVRVATVSQLSEAPCFFHSRICGFNYLKKPRIKVKRACELGFY